MDSLSLYPPSFSGEYFRPLDEKNRVTVPSPWRGEEATDFTLVPDPTGLCLFVMPPPEFTRLCVEAAANPKLDAAERRVFLRLFHANALSGVADKQGRLVLPEDTCRLLDLSGEVALVGGQGRFEVWNSQKWKASRSENTPTYLSASSKIGL